MKSRLTFLAAFIAALMLVSSAAFASGTRMSSMSLTGVEPMIQKDTAQWAWNPATTALFQPLLSIYWDQSANTAGGAVALMKPISGVELYNRIWADFSSSAFLLSADSNVKAWDGTTAWLQGLGGNAQSTLITNSTPPNLSVMMATTSFAYKINDICIGVEGSFGYTSQDSDNEYEWRVKAGAFIPLPKGISVDATISLGQPILEQQGNDGGKYTYETIPTAFDLYAYGRFNFQLSETQTLHLFAKYSFADHSTNFKQNASDTDIDFLRTAHTLQIGLSEEMNFSKTSLFYVGFNYKLYMNYNEYSGELNNVKIPGASEYKYDNTAHSLALHMGAEGQLIGGLTGRIGAIHNIVVHNVNNETDAQTSGQTTSLYSYTTSASLGLAWKIGQFILEGTLNKALFSSGPDCVSGSGLPEGLNLNVTVVYFFGAPAAAPAAANEEK